MFRLVRALGPSLLNPVTALRLVRTGWRFRARGWYRRPPFLPLPPAEYMEWRMHTAYGDEHAVPPKDEFQRYLKWADKNSGRGGG